MRIRFAAVLLLFAAPLPAAYVARDAWIPVAGHATDGGGRHYETTVYMTDTSRSQNRITLSFFRAGEVNAAPRSISLELGPQETAAVDVGPQLVGDSGGVGALNIRSAGALLTEAHVYTHTEKEPLATVVGEVVNAIPAQYAIGAGDSTLVHVPAGPRYKLYVVETSGFPLYFSVIGVHGAERRLFLGPHDARSWDLAQLLPGTQTPLLRISGVNGSGKIIVLGTAVAEESQDFSAYEMMLPARARHRMTWPEMTTYTAVALAIAVTALYRWKNRETKHL